MDKTRNNETTNQATTPADFVFVSLEDWQKLQIPESIAPYFTNNAAPAGAILSRDQIATFVNDGNIKNNLFFIYDKIKKDLKPINSQVLSELEYFYAGQIVKTVFQRQGFSPYYIKIFIDIPLLANKLNEIYRRINLSSPNTQPQTPQQNNRQSPEPESESQTNLIAPISIIIVIAIILSIVIYKTTK